MAFRFFEKSQKPIDKVGNARYNQKHQIHNSYMITRKKGSRTQRQASPSGIAGVRQQAEKENDYGKD